MALVFISFFSIVKADTLAFKPVAPCVVVGEKIQLSVSGILNNIRWIIGEDSLGSFESSKERDIIIYRAPSEAGIYRIRVMGEDSRGKPKFDGVEVEVVSQAEADKRPECTIIALPKVAIIIHSGNKSADGAMQIADDIISAGLDIYNTLRISFYEEDEIYITPLNLSLKEAFETAKAKSKMAKSQILKTKDLSEKPLVVIFIGDNPPDRLSEWLDDYQNDSHNKIVVIIDAPYSGRLLNTLKGDNRLIITSTNETSHNHVGHYSFSKLYFKRLEQGITYSDAWEAVFNFYTNNVPYPINQQQPQLEDFTQLKDEEEKRIQALCLNDCTGDLVGYDIEMEVVNNSVLNKKVISAPQIIDFITNRFANELKNERSFYISTKNPNMPNITVRKYHGKWQYSYNSFMTGNYSVTFKKTNDDGQVVNTSSVAFSAITEPSFIGDKLYIPAIIVGRDTFYVELKKQGSSNTLFELKTSRLFDGDITLIRPVVKYDLDRNVIPLPSLYMPNGSSRNNVSLQLLKHQVFELKNK